MTSDYKTYSLEKLQEWVHDALSCGEASPHEIYSAIREAAQEDYQYYKDHSARALGLLELLSGHRPVADKQQDKVIKWQLPVEADPSGEYFVMFPDDLMEAADLKEGDTIEWVDQEDGSYLLKKVEKKTLTYDEAIKEGWTMTDDGFWIPKQE